MTISILRTADAWWVQTASGASRIDTEATTTGELLADRAAIDAALHGGETVPVAGLALLSPVTAPCRVVAQMTAGLLGYQGISSGSYSFRSVVSSFRTFHYSYKQMISALHIFVNIFCLYLWQSNDADELPRRTSENKSVLEVSLSL